MPDVFFYGLFMDRALLIEKGLKPTNERVAKVEDHSLVIGERATLVHAPRSSVHGIVMTLSHPELEELYSGPSLRDYRPGQVEAVFSNGTRAPVLCFNLPVPPAPGEHNSEYADKLRTLASKLGLPANYVKLIK